MNEKDMKTVKKEAVRLREKFRKDYTVIAEEFNKLSEKVDRFLAEIAGQ